MTGTHAKNKRIVHEFKTDADRSFTDAILLRNELNHHARLGTNPNRGFQLHDGETAEMEPIVEEHTHRTVGHRVVAFVL